MAGEACLDAHARSKRRVLVTGATGFVGRAALERLRADGWLVRAAVRELPVLADRNASVDWRRIGDLGDLGDLGDMGRTGSDAAWRELVADCDAVLHLAARVHVMNEDAAGSPLDAYRRSNVAATLALANAAAEAGVRRFLFLSSLKVNGVGRSRPYDESDAPAPADPYAVSKWEAEQALQRVSAATGMEVTILRPPLVYGPGVKANFLRLLRAVNSGLPLPLASIANRRSLIFLGNLVDAIALCLSAPAAAGRTYLVSDGDDLSTPDLVRAVAQALQRPARLLPCPESLLRLAGRVFGREAAIDRLLGSLPVDSRRIRRELHWLPPYSPAQGLRESADWFLCEIRRENGSKTGRPR